VIDLPTHLDLADSPYWGLTFGQVLLAFGGFFLGFLLWHILPHGLALTLRVSIAVAPLALGLLLALVRPAGRGVLAWVGIVRQYLRTPKVTLWSAR